jgi:hypothetical protein
MFSRSRIQKCLRKKTEGRKSRDTVTLKVWGEEVKILYFTINVIPNKTE